MVGTKAPQSHSNYCLSDTAVTEGRDSSPTRTQPRRRSIAKGHGAYKESSVLLCIFGHGHLEVVLVVVGERLIHALDLVALQRQAAVGQAVPHFLQALLPEAGDTQKLFRRPLEERGERLDAVAGEDRVHVGCLLYTSDAADDLTRV